MKRTWVWWSSGKDSAWALHRLRLRREVEVVGIVTTLTDPFDRVSIHGLRRDVLLAQADRLELPLHEVRIPYPCSNEEYESAVKPLLARAQDEAVGAMAFGDLFLSDVRTYREKLLTGTGIEPLFPIWGEDTSSLARRILSHGVEAWITCVDPRVLEVGFVGRPFNLELLEELPSSVDACGENGEFHTCVVDGPFFREPICVAPGKTLERDGFAFTDLGLVDHSTRSGTEK